MNGTKRSKWILLVILIGLLVIAGILLKNKKEDSPAPRQDSAFTESNEEMPPLSNNNDTESIEADLENTNFSELDAELK